MDRRLAIGSSVTKRDDGIRYQAAGRGRGSWAGSRAGWGAEYTVDWGVGWTRRRRSYPVPRSCCPSYQQIDNHKESLLPQPFLKKESWRMRGRPGRVGETVTERGTEMIDKRGEAHKVPLHLEIPKFAHSTNEPTSPPFPCPLCCSSITRSGHNKSDPQPPLTRLFSIERYKGTSSHCTYIFGPISLSQLPFEFPGPRQR